MICIPIEHWIERAKATRSGFDDLPFWQRELDALLDGTFLKPAAEIARQLEAARIDGSRPIVSHCKGGGRAALAALAAVVAGRDDVHVYFLSFADWAADESCSLER
jgi:3-mercaptopyruvate sulfurtransferase SseA